VLIVFEVLRRRAHYGAAESIIFACIAFLTDGDTLLVAGIVGLTSFLWFAILACKKPDIREIVQTMHPMLPHILVGLLWVFLVSK
jgi:hypothetical protein